MGERQTLVLMGVLVMVATVVAGFAYFRIDRRAANEPSLSPGLAGVKWKRSTNRGRDVRGGHDS